MSSSYNTEKYLKDLIAELYGSIAELEEALKIIEILNHAEGLREQVKSAKNRAKEWMK